MRHLEQYEYENSPTYSSEDDSIKLKSLPERSPNRNDLIHFNQIDDIDQ